MVYLSNSTSSNPAPKLCPRSCNRWLVGASAPIGPQFRGFQCISVSVYTDTLRHCKFCSSTVEYYKYSLSFLDVFLAYWSDSLCTSQDRNGKRLPASPAVKSLQRGLCCVDALWIHSFPVLTRIPPRKVCRHKKLYHWQAPGTRSISFVMCTMVEKDHRSSMVIPLSLGNSLQGVS